jgi:MSHA biogenesis protein MshL
MALFRTILTVLLIFMMGGCALKPQPQPQRQTKKTVIKPFEPIPKTNEKTKTPPPMVFAPTYQKVSPLDNKYITLNAKNAPLSQFLYAIAKAANLNLVISDGVNANQRLTLNLNQVPLTNALNVIMNMTGYYYQINGNILYVKSYMTKIFKIPYIHATSSYKANLGGDVIGSNTQENSSSSSSSSSSTIQGNFGLAYDNPKTANDFYKQLKQNIKSLLSKNGKFTLNTFTGTLIVTDKKENIQKIAKFLKTINKTATKGVLIEAKILEIVLNKSHQLGINWSDIINGVAGGTLKLAQNLGLQNSYVASMTYTNNNFNMVIQALESAGHINTISNPRIRVLNGQSALILSGDIVPFWEKSVTYVAVTNGTSTTVEPEVTYTRRDVLQGVSLGVTPIIKNDGTIILNIVPVSTSIESVVTFKDENHVVAMAPKLNIKELGTVIRTKNDSMIIIGGLISNSKSKTEDEVPFLSKIPILGNLFKRTVYTETKRELVILLRIRIVNE